MSKRSTARSHQSTRRHNLWLPLVIVGSILVITVAALLFTQPEPSQPGVPVEVSGSPRLSLDRKAIDFGDVPVNQMVRASFTLSNVGDESLRFSYSPIAQVVEGS